MKNRIGRRVKTAGVGGEIAKKLASTNVAHRVTDSTFQVSSQYANGTAVAKLSRGPYTYQMLMIAVNVDDELVVDTVSHTFEKGGRHFLKSEFMHNYVSEVELTINGTVERRQTVADFLALNGYRGLDLADGYLVMPFGGPNLFHNDRQEDAYMLGTSNLRELEVHFKMTDDWNETTMRLELLAEWANIAKPLEFIETHSTKRYTVSGDGEMPISIAANADIAGIFVFHDGIAKHADLTIDDQLMFSGNTASLQAACALYGGDITALGNHLAFDFWRDGEAHKALRRLSQKSQRDRNAEILLTLDLEGATEVRILTIQCGRYASQN